MSPHDQGRSSFHQVAKEVGRQGCSKQRNHDFSGSEFLPGKKRSLSSSCSALLSSQGMRVLPSDRPTVLYWVLVKIPPASAEDVRDGGSTPGSGSSSGGGNGNPFQYSRRISWTEELGELQSMGSQRITSDWRSWHSHSTVCSLTFYPMNIVKCSFLYTPGLVCFVMQYLVTVRHTQHKSTKWSSRSVHLFQLWSMICHFSYIHHLEN